MERGALNLCIHIKWGGNLGDFQGVVTLGVARDPKCIFPYRGEGFLEGSGRKTRLCYPKKGLCYPKKGLCYPNKGLCYPKNNYVTRKDDYVTDEHDYVTDEHDYVTVEHDYVTEIHGGSGRKTRLCYRETRKAVGEKHDYVTRKKDYVTRTNDYVTRKMIMLPEKMIMLPMNTIMLPMNTIMLPRNTDGSGWKTRLCYPRNTEGSGRKTRLCYRKHGPQWAKNTIMLPKNTDRSGQKTELCYRETRTVVGRKHDYVNQKTRTERVEIPSRRAGETWSGRVSSPRGGARKTDAGSRAGWNPQPSSRRNTVHWGVSAWRRPAETERVEIPSRRAGETRLSVVWKAPRLKPMLPETQMFIFRVRQA